MGDYTVKVAVLLLHHAVIVLWWSARCWLQSSLATRQRTHTRAAPTASHTRPDRAPSTPCVPRTATHTHNTEHKQTPGNQTVSHIHIKAVGGWVLESTASPATTARSRSAALPARRCLAGDVGRRARSQSCDRETSSGDVSHSLVNACLRSGQPYLSPGGDNLRCCTVPWSMLGSMYESPEATDAKPVP